MRGNQKLASACLAAFIIAIGPVLGVAVAAEGKFIAPVQADVLRGFEAPSHRFGAGHRGIDYGVPPGTAVAAAALGVVTFAGPVAGDYLVTVEHSGGIQTTYSYLDRIDVSVGDRVAQGQVVAASGHGHPGGPPGLHFGARLNGEYIDPRSLLVDADDISDLLQLQPAAAGRVAAAAPLNVVPRETINLSGDGGRRPESWLGPVPTAQVEPAPASGQRFPVPGASPLAGQAPSAAGAGESPVGPSHLVVPANRDPGKVTIWWSKLNDAQRTGLIEADPRRVGQQEGLPASVRDSANREALEREIRSLGKRRAAATRKLREAEARYGGRYGEPGNQQHLTSLESARSKLESLKGRMRSARHLEESLARAASKRKDGLRADEVFLLDFDTKFARGEGRAVVALGNPDTARQVGIVVPGINNRLANFDGTMRKAANLRETVYRRHGAEASRLTSTIAWLGYDTPESVFDAMDPGEAKAGSKRLEAFIENLRLVQRKIGNEGGKIRLFGHSYGSTTAAVAAKNGMKVEDLALLGSPGGATNHRRQLVGADRVWAGRFWSDVIRLATGFALLGDDPTNRNFGSIRIPTCCRFLGHGDYFQMGTRSVQNLANILVGEYDAVS